MENFQHPKLEKVIAVNIQDPPPSFNYDQHFVLLFYYPTQLLTTFLRAKKNYMHKLVVTKLTARSLSFLTLYPFYDFLIFNHKY